MRWLVQDHWWMVQLLICYIQRLYSLSFTDFFLLSYLPFLLATINICKRLYILHRHQLLMSNHSCSTITIFLIYEFDFLPSMENMLQSQSLAKWCDYRFCPTSGQGAPLPSLMQGQHSVFSVFLEPDFSLHHSYLRAWVVETWQEHGPCRLRLSLGTALMREHSDLSQVVSLPTGLLSFTLYWAIIGGHRM